MVGCCDVVPAQDVALFRLGRSLLSAPSASCLDAGGVLAVRMAGGLAALESAGDSCGPVPEDGSTLIMGDHVGV